MQYDLIFEGGGAKGSVFVGAMDEFTSRGHTARRFVGTSAGAITATLMAAGFTPAEMLAAVNEKQADGSPRFASFMDIPESFEEKDVRESLTWSILDKASPSSEGLLARMVGRTNEKIVAQLMKVDAYRETFSFLERGGLYEGRKFLEWMAEKLDSKIAGLGNATFAQFHEKTGSDLSLVVTDTAAKEMRVLNHRTAPDCPVAWGARMSMSIPFVWQEVRWDASWGEYMGESIAGNTIVDGGVLSNFPLKLLTSNDEAVKAIMGDEDPDEVANLGFIIDESLPVPNSGDAAAAGEAENGGMLGNIKRIKTVHRITRLVDTMTDAHDKLAILAHEDQVCRLPAKGYGTTEFDMSQERLDALVEAGRQAMRSYFEARR
ncbi:putative acylesterase/phospholipase RssA, contains patatin domain [Mariprofundus ferrinatatus]|uniref:Putative acylesterase/phospholipase RssA, contains patatin domain n=1 Tax=Mariprofundus ferrinatatus TaxID=1921087 RepID=A0A2K8L9G9_9PROT|nr:patatin-like phospholipase family protein [Mariprofundus ferrinatatus]ATX82531.1 putative acylesterase/phospholipase RssA, contains patatin domain [Mariprofundus ferrinatatus]